VGGDKGPWEEKGEKELKGEEGKDRAPFCFMNLAERQRGGGPHDKKSQTNPDWGGREISIIVLVQNRGVGNGWGCGEKTGSNHIPPKKNLKRKKKKSEKKK